MFERWGIADGSGLLVRDNFGRFVVSASVETSGDNEVIMLMVVPFLGVRGIATRVLLKEDSMTSWPTWRRWRSRPQPVCCRLLALTGSCIYVVIVTE